MIAVTGASVTFCRLPSRTRGFSRSFAAGVEHDAHGEAVRTGRAPAHQIVQGSKLLTRNRLIEPLVLSARLAKDRIKRGIIERRHHNMPPHSEAILQFKLELNYLFEASRAAIHAKVRDFAGRRRVPCLLGLFESLEPFVEGHERRGLDALDRPTG